jgi:hypothetical protein
MGQTKTTKTQLIAHDKEVYDIAFAKGKDVFATVGADGSVRMFDLRYDCTSLISKAALHTRVHSPPRVGCAWDGGFSRQVAGALDHYV